MVHDARSPLDVILLLAILLALFLLPSPWSVLAILGAAVVEVSGVLIGIWYTRRRRAQVGVQMLVDGRAEVIVPLAPQGQVRLDGEIWQARCARGAKVGETVLVRAVEGLTLLVERAEPSDG